MPIGALFDPNLQARGVFPGILLDQLLQEARTSLAGQGGPTPAATLQSQQPGFPVSEGGAGAGSPAGGPTPASLGGRAGIGGSAGFLTGMAGSALGIPGLGFPFAFANAMDALSNFSFNPPTSNFQAGFQSFLGTSPRGGIGTSDVGRSGQTDPTAPGPEAPGETSAPDAGGGVSGVFEQGGTVPGRRGRSKRITAHAGETVVNEAASKRFKPWLDAMNVLVQPNPTLDDALDRARKFFKD